MPELRESKAYIQFLRNNLLLIFAPGLLLGLLGYYYQSQKPVVHNQNILLEVVQEDFEPASLTVISDNVVGLVRSANVQKTLMVEAGAVRIAPGLIRLDAFGTGREIVHQNLQNIKEYVKGYYNDKGIFVEQRGEVINSTKFPNVYLGFFLGFMFGLFVGLIFSLIRTYLRLY